MLPQWKSQQDTDAFVLFHNICLLDYYAINLNIYTPLYDSVLPLKACLIYTIHVVQSPQVSVCVYVFVLFAQMLSHRSEFVS